jgi:hypothetical protein
MPSKTKYPLLDRFIWYLNERWAIHQKRLKGLPPPWTDDAALQKYRFCQVRREDDRVTRWIHENWLRPHADDPDLWHAMCVARTFNLPATLDAIGWSSPWSKRGKRVLETARILQRSGDVRVFTGAYMVNTHGKHGGVLWSDKYDCPLIEYSKMVFDKLWANGEALRPKRDEQLALVHSRLASQFGFGPFMANQVVADIKYGHVLANAPDWETFAASGPGSLRGLNRVCGRELNQRWREADWHGALLAVRKVILPQLPRALRSLDAQNIEHGLCEFDKWCRVQEGGRPKQTYTVVQSNYCMEVA